MQKLSVWSEVDPWQKIELQVMIWLPGKKWLQRLFFGWWKQNFFNKHIIIYTKVWSKSTYLHNSFKKTSLFLQVIQTTPLDKQVIFRNIGSILVSWYNKEMSSWYLAKLRYQVDVCLISIWGLYFLTLFWYLQVEKLRSKSQ
jgi:hypothetical protein